MIKKIYGKVKKLALVLAISILAINIAAYSALAAISPTSTSTPTPTPGVSSNIARGQQMMNQMMGTNYNSMNDFMDQMMGRSGAQSMYEMMGRIDAAGLNTNDTRPLRDFMNACQSQSSGYNFGGMMGNWNWSNMMGNGWGINSIFLILGGIIMIIFWALIILAAVALLRWIINSLKGDVRYPGFRSSGAMEILKEKYAKGEITREEFEAKKKDIM